MNKKEIINILKKYDFDKNKYVVISGACMVLYGIKETTSDIDISVTKEYYNKLLKQFNCEFERINEFGEKIYYIDNIINFGNTYYTEDKIYIDSIPVTSIEELIKLKKYLNREKDISELKKIYKFKENNYERH